MGFVHLQVHSEYSLLESPIQIEQLVKQAEKLNMSHVALTDNGTMFGVIQFYLKAKGNGIIPIVG